MSATIADPYDILGLTRSATPREIRKRYKRLAAKFHPDRNSDPDAAEQFKRVVTVYSQIKNAIARQSWERQSARPSTEVASPDPLAPQSPPHRPPLDGSERSRREKFARAFAEALAANDGEFLGVKSYSMWFQNLFLAAVLGTYTFYFLFATGRLGHAPLALIVSFPSRLYWFMIGTGLVFILGPRLR